jgi:Tol biopolymer transport system component
MIGIAVASSLLAAAARAGDQPVPAAPAFSESTALLSRIAVEETFYPVSLTVSGDQRHIAYALKNSNGMFAVMDDRRHGPFEAVAKGTPLIGSGRRHWAYVAYQGAKKAQAFVDGRPEAFYDGIDAFAFSPDGVRWSYRVGVGEKQAVVVDGTAGPLFDIVVRNSGPLFSPNGRRLAYGALNGPDGYLVVDGHATGVDGTVSSIVFSPDSSHLAYALQSDGRYRVVRGGQPGQLYDAVTQLTFSPDSKQLIYLARKGEQWLPVLDGRELMGGGTVGMPLFSPDSRRLLYALNKGDDWHMVVNDKPDPAFARLGVYLFSSDSLRFAYMAQGKEGGRMVVDGRMEAIYDSVGMPVFSADSKQVAYRANHSGKWFVVQNGKAHRERHDGLRRPVFSPAGGRLAYVAIDGKQMAMVVDEQVLGRYDAVTFPFFSPQGTHVAYAGCQDNQWRIYVDGKPGQVLFDAFLKDGLIVFDSENHCRTVVLKMPGPQFVRLDISISEDPV